MDLDKLLSEETAGKVKETVKKKKDGRGGNHGGHLKSPIIGTNGLNVNEGDNAKYLMLNVELMNMPEIDLHDEDVVRTRLSDYFALYARYDTKPTVAGMAIALGMTRQTLWAIAHNAPTGSTGYKSALPDCVTDYIKKAYNLMENLWENYMLNGKINPVTGIFLGKNNYGYQDKTEYVVTPNTQADDYNADDIRERYIGQMNEPRLATIDETNDSRDSND